MAGNRYFNCLTPSGEPLAWDPPAVDEMEVWPDSVYFGRVFEAVDRILRRDDLTFYLTADLHELPSYGDDVVAVVVGDELCRIPRYLHRVGALFKTYGTYPRLGCHPFREPSSINFTTLAFFLFRYVRVLPGLAYYARHYLIGLLRGRTLRMYEIPVGTLNQGEVEPPDIASRHTAMAFAGSVAHGRLAGSFRDRLRDWVSPKDAARRAMLQNAEAMASRRGLPVELKVKGGYMDSIAEDPDEYSQMLANAKISLVPRGTSPQTLRFFQSLRAGCVIVTDVLPAQWFYTGSPAVRVRRWRDLDETVSPLLHDGDGLATIQRQTLEWWHTRCSEAAVAAFMAERLETSTG